MKLVLVYYACENRGRALGLQGHARAARGMGHEAIVPKAAGRGRA
jgi:hypothetical protein